MSHASASAGPSNNSRATAYQASAAHNFETPSPVGNNHSNHSQTHNFHNLNFDDSLTLPPINSNSQQHDNYTFDDDHLLPSLDDSDFFDAFPPPLPPPDNSPPPHTAASALFPPYHRDSSSRHFPPPPSNQLASLQQDPQRSFEYQYSEGLHDSSSPDPFADLFFLAPSPPVGSRSRTPPHASPVVDLTESSPPMPPNKKRKAESSDEPSTSKVARRSARPASPRLSQDPVELVDLEEVESKKDYEDFKAKQQAEAIRKQNLDESNKPVKLAEFQCIICMDNPTDLTVTHCGHLFCSECLHSALNAGDKRSCPVCRTVINMGKPGGKMPKNGVFPLEMKLMTANKKGKQPVKN